MAKDIYRKVQQQLDQYSIGFPETESGVEIKRYEKELEKQMAEQ